MTRLWSRLAVGWNAFFFRPFDLRIVSMFRVCYAVVVLASLALLGSDLTYFFGPDGVLPLDASQSAAGGNFRTLFEVLPDTDGVIATGYALAVMHAVLLLMGWFPRVQALGLFFWLVAFQHRAIVLFDGQDQLLRLFAFFLIFIPSHRFISVHAWLRRRRGEAVPARVGCAWAMRLVQIQMTLVYVGSAIAKARGAEWRDGTAMWFVTRLDNAFGRFPLPSDLLDSLPVLQAMTWGTLAFEIALPILLWCPSSRRFALWLALLFHLAVDYAMMMFLFQYVMLVGLLSFAAVHDDGTTTQPNGDR